MELKVKQQQVVKVGEVTPEILRAGVESNQTPHSHPSRFLLILDTVYYDVFSGGKWNPIDTFPAADIQEWMAADTYDETIWVTPVTAEVQS